MTTREQNTLTMEFRYRFEAAHRFTSTASEKCQTPHGHTWYATAVFALRSDRLAASAMAAEFGETKRLWREFIAEVVDHSFLHAAGDPLVASMRATIPNVRLLPFPTDPTTEMIAALFAEKLKAMHATVVGATNVAPIGVTIEETPTNSVAFRWLGDGSRPAWFTAALGQAHGWWESSDPHSRDLSL